MLFRSYGCYSRFLRNGSVYFYSYRDPSIDKTYSAYKNMAHFLKEFCKTNVDLTKYILGTINIVDKPYSNSEKADLAIARYLNGVTPEIQQKERNEILSTTSKKLQVYIPLLEKIVEKQNICTIGNRNMIYSQSQLFSQIMSYMPSI